MKKIYLHKNYILSDKFLDYMNKYGTLLGYRRDDSYLNFDKELLLDNYINKNKKIFIKKIRNELSKECMEYETDIGNVDIIIPTKSLYKYFKNGDDYNGHNLSMITIEYCNLQITKNNIISNCPPQQKFYKYKNWLLKEECKKNGIKIDYSFILGRRYKNYPCYDYLYENNESYENLYSEIREHFHKIKTDQYILGRNIFPNMKNKSDFPWHNAKKKIATRIREITLLRGISCKERDKYVSNGIRSYEDIDSPLVNNSSFLYKKDLKIENISNSLFIDFEILTNIYDDFSSFPLSNTADYIFNIGCGYIKRRQFSFNSYIAHSLDEEEKILNDFILFINNLKGEECTIFHWTNIEKRLFEKKIKQYDISVNKKVIWFDLHKYFKDNKVLIKNCYTYKLKHVARALNSHGLIKSKWDNTFSDGLGAMTGYIKYLSTKDSKLIKDIAHYNMIDCKVLWEILNLFK